MKVLMVQVFKPSTCEAETGRFLHFKLCISNFLDRQYYVEWLSQKKKDLYRKDISVGQSLAHEWYL